jgi:hypothetical protein
MGGPVTTEALYGPVSDQPGYTAHAPLECLNGCHEGAGGAREAIQTDPGQLLCSRCATRLDKWLRSIPDHFALLPAVVDHGTVPADPGTKHTKRPDPPAPMRLEVIDLLDTRPGYGALGIVHSWAELVRDERRQPRRCVCGHDPAGHITGALNWCIGEGCECTEYRPVQPTVTSECGLLAANLPWVAGQAFIGELYDEIKQLHRTLADTVGEYRVKPVGKCAAFIDRPGVPVQVLCGGALVMDKERVSVKCLSCGQRHEANEGLRELGVLVGRLIKDTGNDQLEAS